MSHKCYKFDRRKISGKINQTKKRLKANTGLDDLVGYGCKAYAKNLSMDPLRYRDFGPYWWALKDLLIRQGCAIGDTVDTVIAKEYCGKTDEETLVMADCFRDFYLSNFFVYTNTFVLDEFAEEQWTLYDPDYERLAH